MDLGFITCGIGGSFQLCNNETLQTQGINFNFFAIDINVKEL
jgi:hypothetical protein